MEILLDIIRSVDYNILLLIADRLRGGVLDPVMTMLSLIGNGGAVWITLAVLLLFFRKTRRAGAAMLLAMLAGFLVGNLWLKELVMRPRPFVTHSDLTALLAPGDRWSFPSGHALSSFAAATALWCFHKKTGLKNRSFLFCRCKIKISNIVRQCLTYELLYFFIWDIFFII